LDLFEPVLASLALVLVKGHVGFILASGLPLAGMAGYIYAKSTSVSEESLS
jgi:hypothetical protein